MSNTHVTITTGSLSHFGEFSSKFLPKNSLFFLLLSCENIFRKNVVPYGKNGVVRIIVLLLYALHHNNILY